MVIKHGTVDCFFVLCRNAAILSFLVSNKRKLVVGSLSRSSLAPVSFQSTFDPFTDAMFRTAWFLVLLLCYVLQSIISENDDKLPHAKSGLSKNSFT